MAASRFTVTLEIRGVDNDTVHFKSDGARFQEVSTVKLNVQKTYKVTVTLRPQRLLLNWYIMGEKMEFNREKPKKEEESCTVYSCIWSTDSLLVTKRAARDHLGMVLELDSGVSLSVGLQVKLYPACDKSHAKWGPQLHQLELKCHAKDGHSEADILEQKFL